MDEKPSIPGMDSLESVPVPQASPMPAIPPVPTPPPQTNSTDLLEKAALTEKEKKFLDSLREDML